MRTTTQTTFIPETVQALLGLARGRASAVLHGSLPEGLVSFLLSEGRVRDCAYEGHGSLELTFNEVLEPGALKKAGKLASREGITVGEAVLREGLIGDDEAVAAVISFVSTSFARLITLQKSSIRVDSDVESFELSDLGANYEILLPLEELLLNALAEHDAWDFVVQNFSSLRDVYYATPNSVQLFHQQDDYPAEVAVLQSLDGEKDVEEVIASSGLDPFLALQAIQGLAESAFIELVNPVQLFQLGLAAEEGGNWEKALHLFQRSLERGLDDFDLQFRLAQAYEKTGDHTAAIERYQTFAEKCAREFRIEDALCAMRKIMALDPATVPVRQRYIELLRKHDKREEAARESLRLADMLHKKGRDDVARTLLEEAVEAFPEDEALQERYAAICEACGATAEARRANERLAKVYAERQDSGKALEHYQRQFVEGEDTADVRQRLIELHLVQGNREKALEHLGALLALGNPYGIRDLTVLRTMHQKRCELRPGDRDSTWFLIEDALALKDTAAAERYLRELIAHLNPEEDGPEATAALKRLTRILPEKHEYRWQLANALCQGGNEAEAVETLRTLARRERQNGSTDESLRALREILRLAPFDSDAREDLIDILGEGEDAEALMRERRHLALLRILKGEADKAQALCREIASDRAEDAYLLLILADLCTKSGDKQMAGEQYARAGKLLLAGRNLGLTELCAAKLKQLGTHTSAVEELSEGLALASAPPPATTAPPPAATITGAAKEPQSKEQEEKQRTNEAFTPMKQRVVKGSVASITARLKSLKVGKPLGGGSETGSTVPATFGAGTATTSVGSAINKLKALGGKGGATPDPEPAAADPEMPASDPPSSPAKLGGAAARLRALKGLGDSADSADAPKPPGEPTDSLSGEVSSATVSDPTKPIPDLKKRLKLGGAASRLAALRGE